MATGQDSMGTLFSDLSKQIGDPIRQQAVVAHLETAAAVERFERLAVGMVRGAPLAVGGGTAFVAAVVMVLVALGLPAWAAAGIVGVALAAIGYVTVQRAAARLNRDELMPRITVRKINANAE